MMLLRFQRSRRAASGRGHRPLRTGDDTVAALHLCLRSVGTAVAGFALSKLAMATFAFAEAEAPRQRVLSRRSVIVE
jgi:hypothetical protein